MAKMAMIAMPKHVGEQLASENVIANSIAPGSIAFPGGGWARFQHTQPPKVVAECIRRNLAAGKFRWPQPFSALVAFLVSDRADLITPRAIDIDGSQSRTPI